jgi:hypothetical protein
VMNWLGRSVGVVKTPRMSTSTSYGNTVEQSMFAE